MAALLPHFRNLTTLKLVLAMVSAHIRPHSWYKITWKCALMPPTSTWSVTTVCIAEDRLDGGDVEHGATQRWW